MNWIELQGKYYNITYFRKIYFKDNVFCIEYSNGDIVALYSLNREEISRVNKIFSNDSK